MDLRQEFIKFADDCGRDPAYGGSYSAGITLRDLELRWEKLHPGSELPQIRRNANSEGYKVIWPRDGA